MGGSDQGICKDLWCLNRPHLAAVRCRLDKSILICDLDGIFGWHADCTGACLLHSKDTSLQDFFCYERSCPVVYKYIIAVFAGKKPLIYRIISLLAACDHFGYFCKMIAFYDFSFTIGNHFFSCYQNNFLDQRTFLKTFQ